MSLTIPSQTQPGVTRTAAAGQSQPATQLPTTLPETIVPQTNGAVTPVIEDQSRITPGLQGPPAGGDAQRVAAQPGQVAFVDGAQPAGPAAAPAQERTMIATTTYGQCGAVSNNPAETFSIGRAINSITAALVATVVGMPSTCYSAVIQPLRESFAIKPSDDQGAVNRSQNRRPAQAPANSNQNRPEAQPVTQPVQPVIPPVQPLRRPQQTEENPG